MKPLRDIDFDALDAEFEPDTRELGRTILVGLGLATTISFIGWILSLIFK